MGMPVYPPPLPSSVSPPPAVALDAGSRLSITRLWPFWLWTIISFVLIPCAWFFPPLLVLPPGLMFLKVWGRWQRREGFWRIALAGLMMVAVTGSCLLMGIGLWVKVKIEQASRQDQDQENVRFIVQALEGWKAEHQVYPAELSLLIQEGWLPWPRLISPWHRGQPQAGKSDYQYQRLPEGRFLLSRDGKRYDAILKME